MVVHLALYYYFFESIVGVVLNATLYIVVAREINKFKFDIEKYEYSLDVGEYHYTDSEIDLLRKYKFNRSRMVLVAPEVIEWCTQRYLAGNLDVTRAGLTWSLPASMTPRFSEALLLGELTGQIMAHSCMIARQRVASLQCEANLGGTLGGGVIPFGSGLN
jgi:hypothetical protein